MSLTIAVQYLMGRVMATSATSWDQAEWPPHPDRFFQALVATHFEDAPDAPLADGRAALEWLEAEHPPEIHCSRASERDAVTYYVPVNDVKPPKSKAVKAICAKDLAVLPDTRPRQARTFPVAVPDSDTVYFVWEGDPPPGIRGALDSLCSKLTRLGHSSSLVWSWLAPAPPPTAQLLRLVPDLKGALKLRAPRKGRLERLEQAYRAEPPLRPPVGTWVGYSRHTESPFHTGPSGYFEPKLLIFKAYSERNQGRMRVGVEDAPRLAMAVRHTLMSRLGVRGRAVPEALSGHLPDGTPTGSPHIAVLPLPFVGSRHADGHLLGMGLACPKGASLGEVLGEILEQPLEIRLGSWGVWCLRLDRSDWPAEALESDTWSASREGARVWATVTPIVLDRHLKTKLPSRADRGAYSQAMARQVEEIRASIEGSCAHSGLPKPLRLEVFGHSLFEGAPSARAYPRLRRHNQARFQAHAYLEFEEPVRGPLLLGSGRYCGYGLCRPYKEKGAPRAARTFR